MVETDSTFNLLKSGLQLVSLHEPQSVSESKSRGTKYCLTAPCSLAYLPQVSSFLVTESQHNRIGIYSAEMFEFKGWLKNPTEGKSFNCPTSICCLLNHFLVICEKNQLIVWDSKLSKCQKIVGNFHGLAEGPKGELFTLMEEENVGTVVRKFVLNESSDEYEFSTDTLVTVVQDFENWTTSSKCRFLAVSEEKIFITDLGLHKVYMLDLVGNRQTAFGYMGSQEGQLKGPHGLLVDEGGNLLVADNGNDRLVLFSQEGRFLRTLASPEINLSAPHGLVRHERFVLAAFTGKEGRGAVARYQMEEEDEVVVPNRPLE